MVADVLSLPACENQTVAFSVLEALRFAAARVLDMHMDDLQILVVGYVERDEVDALLWDPMPGGSGLLSQIVERFGEVVNVAREVVEDCPSVCESSCVDCLQTFRNAYYHKHLNRGEALLRLEAYGAALELSHDIPSRQPSEEPREGSYPVNQAERTLRQLLLAAGFEEGVRGRQIRLDRAIGTTTPDVFYPGDEEDEGVCIYLDGLSRHLHGNPETAERDRLIRDFLRNNTGCEVIEIAASDLNDLKAMTRYFRRLAGYLSRPDLRETVRDDQSWFDRADDVRDG